MQRQVENRRVDKVNNINSVADPSTSIISRGPGPGQPAGAASSGSARKEVKVSPRKPHRGGAAGGGVKVRKDSKGGLKSATSIVAVATGITTNNTNSAATTIVTSVSAAVNAAVASITNLSSAGGSSSSLDEASAAGGGGGASAASSPLASSSHHHYNHQSPTAPGAIAENMMPNSPGHVKRFQQQEETGKRRLSKPKELSSRDMGGGGSYDRDLGNLSRIFSKASNLKGGANASSSSENSSHVKFLDRPKDSNREYVFDPVIHRPPLSDFARELEQILANVKRTNRSGSSALTLFSSSTTPVHSRPPPLPLFKNPFESQYHRYSDRNGMCSTSRFLNNVISEYIRRLCRRLNRRVFLLASSGSEVSGKVFVRNDGFNNPVEVEEQQKDVVMTDADATDSGTLIIQNKRPQSELTIAESLVQLCVDDMHGWTMFDEPQGLSELPLEATLSIALAASTAGGDAIVNMVLDSEDGAVDSTRTKPIEADSSVKEFSEINRYPVVMNVKALEKCSGLVEIETLPVANDEVENSDNEDMPPPPPLSVSVSYSGIFSTADIPPDCLVCEIKGTLCFMSDLASHSTISSNKSKAVLLRQKNLTGFIEMPCSREEPIHEAVAAVVIKKQLAIDDVQEQSPHSCSNFHAPPQLIEQRSSVQEHNSVLEINIMDQSSIVTLKGEVENENEDKKETQSSLELLPLEQSSLATDQSKSNEIVAATTAAVTEEQPTRQNAALEDVSKAMDEVEPMSVLQDERPVIVEPSKTGFLLPPQVFIHPAVSFKYIPGESEKKVRNRRRNSASNAISSLILEDNPMVVDAREVGCYDGRYIRSYCGGDSAVKDKCNATLRSVFVFSNETPDIKVSTTSSDVRVCNDNKLASQVILPTNPPILSPADQIRLCVFSTRAIKHHEEVVLDVTNLPNFNLFQYPCICGDLDKCRVSSVLKTPGLFASFNQGLKRKREFAAHGDDVDDLDIINADSLAEEMDGGGLGFQFEEEEEEDDDDDDLMLNESDGEGSSDLVSLESAKGKEEAVANSVLSASIQVDEKAGSVLGNSVDIALQQTSGSMKEEALVVLSTVEGATLEDDGEPPKRKRAGEDENEEGSSKPVEAAVTPEVSKNPVKRIRLGDYLQKTGGGISGVSNEASKSIDSLSSVLGINATDQGQQASSTPPIRASNTSIEEKSSGSGGVVDEPTLSAIVPTTTNTGGGGDVGVAAAAPKRTLSLRDFMAKKAKANSQPNTPVFPLAPQPIDETSPESNNMESEKTKSSDSAESAAANSMGQPSNDDHTKSFKSSSSLFGGPHQPSTTSTLLPTPSSFASSHRVPPESFKFNTSTLSSMFGIPNLKNVYEAVKAKNSNVTGQPVLPVIISTTTATATPTVSVSSNPPLHATCSALSSSLSSSSSSTTSSSFAFQTGTSKTTSPMEDKRNSPSQSPVIQTSSSYITKYESSIERPINDEQMMDRSDGMAGKEPRRTSYPPSSKSPIRNYKSGIGGGSAGSGGSSRFSSYQAEYETRPPPHRSSLESDRDLSFHDDGRMDRDGGGQDPPPRKSSHTMDSYSSEYSRSDSRPWGGGGGSSYRAASNKISPTVSPTRTGKEDQATRIFGTLY